MGLLEKFDAVEVNADNRISADDRSYCTMQQLAYESAVDAYVALWRTWTSLKNKQAELLGEKCDENKIYHNYLSERTGGKLDASELYDHIEYLHQDFINTIVRYFHSAYRVSFSAYKLERALIPKKDSGSESDEQPQSDKITYQSVLDLMIKEMDGRTFPEHAIFQIKQACHKAVWEAGASEPLYELKKDTIRFNNDFCSTRERGGYLPYTAWSSTGKMDAVLEGMAHYETGDALIKPTGMAQLLNGKEVSDNVIEFPQCEKILQMRMFKNGRVDVKFASVEKAVEFIENYLGIVS